VSASLEAVQVGIPLRRNGTRAAMFLIQAA